MLGSNKVFAIYVYSSYEMLLCQEVFEEQIFLMNFFQSNFEQKAVILSLR
jgi:hypothetical protein